MKSVTHLLIVRMACLVLLFLPAMVFPSWLTAIAAGQRSPFSRLLFRSDYPCGSDDDAGAWMGGTEVLNLVIHDGKLFAGIGYWMDENAGDPEPGPQVLRKDGRDAHWQVENSFSTDYIRIGAMIEAEFTTDAAGNPLNPTRKILVAGPEDYHDDGQASAWVRNDNTRIWTRTGICELSGSKGVRSFDVHRDSVTGICSIFAGLINGQIHRGVFCPEIPGRLQWFADPELAGTGRVMSMTECNGELYASTALVRLSPDDPVQGGLYRRHDGLFPWWELVYQWPYEPVSEDTLLMMRGLTAVPDPLGSPKQVLIGTRAFPGIVVRIDPPRSYAVTVELDIDAYVAGIWGLSEYGGPDISAYNNLTLAVNPVTGETVHILGLWVEYPDLGLPPFNGSHFLVRHLNGTYEFGNIYDNDHPVPAGDSLRGCRTVVVSPFAEDGGRVLYFGGYDCRYDPSHNTAWIWRGRFPGCCGGQPGDVNGDGFITSLDLVVALSTVSGGMEPGVPPCAFPGCADLNDDDTLETVDCLLLASRLAGNQ